VRAPSEHQRNRSDRQDQILVEEMTRHRCVGEDGSSLVVVEYRHLRIARRKTGARSQIGAAWTELLSGELVRCIDRQTFELISTGELIKLADQ